MIRLFAFCFISVNWRSYGSVPLRPPWPQWTAQKTVQSMCFPVYTNRQRYSCPPLIWRMNDWNVVKKHLWFLRLPEKTPLAHRTKFVEISWWNDSISFNLSWLTLIINSWRIKFCWKIMLHTLFIVSHNAFCLGNYCKWHQIWYIYIIGCSLQNFTVTFRLTGRVGPQLESKKRLPI